MNPNARKYVFIVPAVLAAVALIVLLISAFVPAPPVLTGMVEETTIDVASKIPGRLDSIFVREGDRVHRGQVLARLESKEMDAKVGQARSAMEAARARMEMATRGARVEEKEAVRNQYDQARAQFELAEKSWKRVERVFRDSLISAQERDQVEFQYKAAREQMEAARAKNDMVQKGLRSEEIAGAVALFHQAENAFNEANAYHQELELKSSADGEVCKRIADEGEVVASGYPVFTIQRPDDPWVILQVREDQMPGITVGRHLRGTVRAVGTQPVDFAVSSIAVMADFATWKPTNQKGDFDLKTFEVKLRPVHPVAGFRPGMTVQIEL